MTRPSLADHHQDLLERFERLEADVRRGRRRSRFALLAGGTLALVAVGSGLTSAPFAVDIVRTKRLEVLDDSNKIVLLASATKTGGRLDLWDAGGHNSARLGANSTGGDFALWNDKGEQVFAAFAQQRSGRVEVGGASGAPATVISSDDRGGFVEVLDLSGRSAVKTACARQGGEVTANQFHGNGASVLGNDDSGGRITVSHGVSDLHLKMDASSGGLNATRNDQSLWSIALNDDGVRMGLADNEGNARVQLGSTSTGGLVILHNELAKPSVIMGSNRGRSGVQIRNSQDKLILALGSAKDDAGEVQLFNAKGANEVVLVAEATAGRLLLRDSTFQALVEIGVGEGGGRVSIYDQTNQLAASLMGLPGGGGHLSIGTPESSSIGTFDAPFGGTPSLNLFGAGGRSVAAAAVATGGVISLRTHTGAQALVLGAVSADAGGEVSIRNADGGQIVRLGATENGAGELDVYNSAGSRKRSLSAP